MMAEIPRKLYHPQFWITSHKSNCDLQYVVRTTVIDENKLVVDRELADLIQGSPIKFLQIRGGIIQRCDYAQLAYWLSGLSYFGLWIFFRFQNTQAMLSSLRTKMVNSYKP